MSIIVNCNTFVVSNTRKYNYFGDFSIALRNANDTKQNHAYVIELWLRKLMPDAML